MKPLSALSPQFLIPKSLNPPHSRGADYDGLDSQAVQGGEMGRQRRRFVAVSGEAKGSLQQCFESNNCFHYSSDCTSEVAFKGLGDFSKKGLDSDSKYESETKVVEPTNEDELDLSKLGLPQWHGIFSPCPIQIEV
ncbi:hypothetical protein RchiOBHm_Chr4g0415481 [Rosa chinensis]|uniref:Uncharacterized protein n=1 Tax=Rosa chinensis TaxID=74649 RepID=A0A2P6QWP9_ROSCH|nr:hypothetical protein RchiOBHm_Chr4g0415481 [Rosa chinensis]